LTRTRFTLTLVAAAFAAAMVGSTQASASGVTNGEPRFHGAFTTMTTAADPHRLSASQLGLIRVGARTNDRAVVAQALAVGRFASGTSLRTAQRQRQQFAIDSIQPTSPWYAYDAALRKAQRQRQQFAIDSIQPTSPWYAYDAALRKAQHARHLLEARHVR